jgi:hypothetical protein
LRAGGELLLLGSEIRRIDEINEGLLIIER